VYRDAFQGVPNYFNFHWNCTYIECNEEKISNFSGHSHIKNLCLKGWTSSQVHTAACNFCVSFCFYFIYSLGFWWQLPHRALVCCHWCYFSQFWKQQGWPACGWFLQYQTIQSFLQLHCNILSLVQATDLSLLCLTLYIWLLGKTWRM